MAAQLDPDRPGSMLELGPGTGTITRQILARGIAPERLVVVEHDPEFAKLMAKRFPGIHIIQGDAFDLNRTLNGAGSETFAGIISGIPLLNHPLASRRALIEGCFARLKPYAPFIQFSYGLMKPVPPPSGVRVSLAAFVWLNFPPAHVWVYRQK
ncbi:MAG TPA: methyltransferase domain-containing protein [Micropepsaceae bacterium]|nr:methyltransferase domain-containing protein [Micropepsaceae bacterium]